MRKATIFIVLAFLLVLCATPAYANGIPALPHAFYGSVTINGSSAPDGIPISATVDSGDIIATQNPVTTSGGNYGVDSLKLLVQGDGLNGAITFYVNGHEATPSQAVTFESGGGPTQVDLSVTIAKPAWGGGVGARDRTPPRISNVLVCGEGVTETTADICWTTHEKSDSQVEYWTSPSMFSELDEEMVINHHVQLTGLVPGTTYHYKTMSRDKAGNLGVADEYTFTTKGKAPAAAFASSDLSISPGEVEIGETVTISATVANTGTATGSYKVTLKIDGVVEETKEVTLKAGASKEVTFTTSKDAAGSYSVDVNGLSGSFTVKERPAPPVTPAPTPPPPPVAPPTPEKPFNWPLVGGIIAGVVVVGLGVFFWRRRRSIG